MPCSALANPAGAFERSRDVALRDRPAGLGRKHQPVLVTKGSPSCSADTCWSSRDELVWALPRSGKRGVSGCWLWTSSSGSPTYPIRRNH
jgi:hypothetical protein